MSNNRIVFAGLFELMADLRALPAELTDEAGIIVQEHAHTAAAAVQAVYAQHRDSGGLADGVVVEQRSLGRFGVQMHVRSKAKHAWLFDNGSQARHWVGGKSTGTMWGKTPPTHVFVGTMIRFRHAMFEAFKAQLVRHGLVVTGEAA